MMGVYYNNQPKTIVDGLTFALDLTNPRCYSGTGNTINNIGGVGKLEMTNVTIANNCFSFNGTDSEINSNTNINARQLRLNSYHTVEMWVKPTEVAGNVDNDYTLLDCLYINNTNNHLVYLIRDSGGGPKFHMAFWYIDIHGTIPVVVDNWVHVVFMFDTDNKQKIYVNSVFDTESGVLSSPFDGNLAPISIGKFGSFGGRLFQGLIGEVRIYGRALSTTEIAYNFNQTRGKYGI